jgi:hypothetical protein
MDMGLSNDPRVPGQDRPPQSLREVLGRPGKKWVDTGAHVMVLNPGTMADAYPKTADNPHKPYVMWPGTPYQHLMIPVK